MKSRITLIGKQTGPDRVLTSLFFEGRLAGVLTLPLAGYQLLLELVSRSQWEVGGATPA